MQLFDKAVRTLADATGQDWDNLAPDTRDRYRTGLRAMLAVLRDPDAHMAEAGAEIIRNVKPGESEAAFQNDAVTTWRLMIDALRGQSGPAR